MLYIYFSLTVALQVVCAIDGCEFRIQRPHDDELEDFFFSAKKKQNSISGIFIVLRYGRIIYKSRHFLVILVIRVHGTSPNCVTSLLVRIIALYNLHTHLFHTDKLYGIVGDAAFTFNKVGDKGNVIGVTPYSNKYGNTLTEEQREDNTNIARIRVIVENVFALLKKWEFLSCM